MERRRIHQVQHRLAEAKSLENQVDPQTRVSFEDLTVTTHSFEPPVVEAKSLDGKLTPKQECALKVRKDLTVTTCFEKSPLGYFVLKIYFTHSLEPPVVEAKSLDGKLTPKRPCNGWKKPPPLGSPSLPLSVEKAPNPSQ